MHSNSLNESAWQQWRYCPGVASDPRIVDSAICLSTVGSPNTTTNMSATRSSGLCSSPSGTLLPLSPPTLSLASAANTAFEALLDNPPDLVCPVTHELFKEPVINAAGQVYERSAIEAYMRRSLMDPVTRMQLHPTSVLTPVWIVKSRYITSKLCFRLHSVLFLQRNLLCKQVLGVQRKHSKKVCQASLPQSWTRCCQICAQSCGAVWGCKLYCSGKRSTQQILPKHFSQQSIL